METLVVLALSGMLLAAAVPSLAGIWERARARSVAREMATLLRTMRSRAIAERRSVGLVFHPDPGRWHYAIHADGDGDGVQSADVASGVDPLLEGPRRLADPQAGVDFGFLDLPRVRRVPPSSGWMASLGDPVQFGADIVSFSPRGAASSGTLYLTDSRSQMLAIVVYGPTARVRLLRYDSRLEEWVL